MDKFLVTTCVIAALASMTMVNIQAGRILDAIIAKPAAASEMTPAGIPLDCKKSDCDFIATVLEGGYQ